MRSRRIRSRRAEPPRPPFLHNAFTAGSTARLFSRSVPDPISDSAGGCWLADIRTCRAHLRLVVCRRRGFRGAAHRARDRAGRLCGRARLPTAVNDAGLIAQTLTERRLRGVQGRDLNGGDLRRVVRDFLDRVQDRSSPTRRWWSICAGHGAAARRRELPASRRCPHRPRHRHPDRRFPRLRSHALARRRARPGAASSSPTWRGTIRSAARRAGWRRASRSWSRLPASWWPSPRLPNIVAPTGRGRTAPMRPRCRDDASARPAARPRSSPASACARTRPRAASRRPGIRPISAIASFTFFEPAEGARQAAVREVRRIEDVPAEEAYAIAVEQRHDPGLPGIPAPLSRPSVSPAASTRFSRRGARPSSGAARWRATRRRPTGPICAATRTARTPPTPPQARPALRSHRAAAGLRRGRLSRTCRRRCPGSRRRDRRGHGLHPRRAAAAAHAGLPPAAAGRGRGRSSTIVRKPPPRPLPRHPSDPDADPGSGARPAAGATSISPSRRVTPRGRSPSRSRRRRSGGPAAAAGFPPGEAAAAPRLRAGPARASRASRASRPGQTLPAHQSSRAPRRRPAACARRAAARCALAVRPIPLPGTAAGLQFRPGPAPCSRGSPCRPFRARGAGAVDPAAGRRSRSRRTTSGSRRLQFRGQGAPPCRDRSRSRRAAGRGDSACRASDSLCAGRASERRRAAARGDSAERPGLRPVVSPGPRPCPRSARSLPTLARCRPCPAGRRPAGRRNFAPRAALPEPAQLSNDLRALVLALRRPQRRTAATARSSGRPARTPAGSSGHRRPAARRGGAASAAAGRTAGAAAGRIQRPAPPVERTGPPPGAQRPPPGSDRRSARRRRSGRARAPGRPGPPAGLRAAEWAAVPAAVGEPQRDALASLTVEPRDAGSTCPSACRPSSGRRRRTGRPARSPAGWRRCCAPRRGRSPRSLRIQSTAKPKSNLPWFMVLPRFSICQEPAAPLEITSSTASMSRPALLAEMDALGEALHETGDADLVDHLGELARAGDRRGGGRRGQSP